jgi:hypothetical protein
MPNGRDAQYVVNTVTVEETAVKDSDSGLCLWNDPVIKIYHKNSLSRQWGIFHIEDRFFKLFLLKALKRGGGKLSEVYFLGKKLFLLR